MHSHERHCRVFYKYGLFLHAERDVSAKRNSMGVHETHKNFEKHLL